MRTLRTARHRTPRSGVRAAVVLGALLVSASLVAHDTVVSAEAAPAQTPEPAPPVGAAAAKLVSPITEPLAAGVVGVNRSNDSFPNTDVRVLAIAEHGNRIFVGGKFTAVQQASNGAQTAQPFLAAFDRETGAWISTFRPRLDGNVWDLSVTSSGRLIVAGQFTNVNGVSRTNGVASLDPTTGAVTPNWRVDLAVTGTSARPLARTLDIQGDHLYIGGNFTRITGTDGRQRSAGRLARVSVQTGNADGAFLPDVGGIVFDVDATSDRVYVAGDFKRVNGTWSLGLGVLKPSDGTLVPGLAAPLRTWTTDTNNSYQQAVLAVGSVVFQTGAQHSLGVYRASDYRLRRSFVSHPWGDGQALVALNGIVYKGSHANGETREYADATNWPLLTGATSNKPMRWLGAWDATPGSRYDHLYWYPDIGSQNGEGAWELFADSRGCLWAGGDFDRGSLVGGSRRYVGGFARFCPVEGLRTATRLG